jgi:hypothetical protein
MRRRAPWLLVLLLVPLLLGAADAPDDLVSCDGTTTPFADAPIDIVNARGATAEDGLALRFTVTFSAPLPVPDDDGSPLRVDVLLRDPAVPDLSVDYYRDVNRIVRFDAVSPRPPLTVLLLPERTQSPFTNGAQVDGATLTMTFPSRMVMPDPDLAGFDYSGVRWTVVARDEMTCDVLGDVARPSLRLKTRSAAASPVPSLSPGGATATADDGSFLSAGFLISCVVAIGIGSAVGYAAARWRRRTE